LINFGMKSPIS